MKTKAEKLKAVTEDIRSKLPRLMKLEKGCLVFNTRTEHRGEILEVFANKKRNNPTYLVHWISSMPLVNTYDEDYLLPEIEIIGKEPMLNDVLEWLEKGKSANTFNINSRGAIFIEFSATSGYCGIWDLSKPYLHQQSEELINFLYRLL